MSFSLVGVFGSPQNGPGSLSGKTITASLRSSETYVLEINLDNKTPGNPPQGSGRFVVEFPHCSIEYRVADSSNWIRANRWIGYVGSAESEDEAKFGLELRIDGDPQAGNDGQQAGDDVEIQPVSTRTQMSSNTIGGGIAQGGGMQGDVRPRSISSPGGGWTERSDTYGGANRLGPDWIVEIDLGPVDLDPEIPAGIANPCAGKIVIAGEVDDFWPDPAFVSYRGTPAVKDGLDPPVKLYAFEDGLSDGVLCDDGILADGQILQRVGTFTDQEPADYHFAELTRIGVPGEQYSGFSINIYKGTTDPETTTLQRSYRFYTIHMSPDPPIGGISNIHIAEGTSDLTGANLGDLENVQGLSFVSSLTKHLTFRSHGDPCTYPETNWSVVTPSYPALRRFYPFAATAPAWDANFSPTNPLHEGIEAEILAPGEGRIGIHRDGGSVGPDGMRLYCRQDYWYYGPLNESPPPPEGPKEAVPSGWSVSIPLGNVQVGGRYRSAGAIEVSGGSSGSPVLSQVSYRGIDEVRRGPSAPVIVKGYRRLGLNSIDPDFGDGENPDPALFRLLDGVVRSTQLLKRVDTPTHYAVVEAASFGAQVDSFKIKVFQEGEADPLKSYEFSPYTGSNPGIQIGGSDVMVSIYTYDGGNESLESCRHITHFSDTDWRISNLDSNDALLSAQREWETAEFDPMTLRRSIARARFEDDDCVSSVNETRQLMPWGEEVVVLEEDPTPLPDGTPSGTDQDLRYTEWEFYTDPQDEAQYGKVKSYTSNEGNWTMYSYGEGVTVTLEPWKSTIIPAAEVPGTWTALQNLALDPANTSQDLPAGTRLNIEEDTSISTDLPTLATSEYFCDGDSLILFRKSSVFGDSKIFRVLTRSTNQMSAGVESKTYTLRYPNDVNILGDDSRLRGRIVAERDEAGATTGYQYKFGVWNNPGFTPDPDPDTDPHLHPDLRIVETTGVDATDPELGMDALNPSGFQVVANRSVQTESIFTKDGLVSRETYICTGAGPNDRELASWERFGYDDQGREIEHVVDGEVVSSTSFPTHAVTVTTDRAGNQTRTEYDAEGRLWRSTRLAGNTEAATGVGDIETRYEHEGLTSTTFVGNRRVSVRVVDALGRPAAVTDAIGDVTTYNYDDAFGGAGSSSTVYVNRDTPLEIATTSYADGRTESVAGTGTINQYYDYGVESSTGFTWSTVTSGSFGSARSQRTVTRMDGSIHQVITPSPATPGQSVSTDYVYDTTIPGQLVKVSGGGVRQLTSYPATNAGIMGLHQLSGLDADASGPGVDVLDPDSNDRVAETETFYEKNLDGADRWWRTSISRVYHVANDDSQFLESLSSQRLWCGDGERSIEELATGDRIVSHVSYPGNQVVTTTVTSDRAPAASYTTEINGFLTASQGAHEDAPHLRKYDSEGRLVSAVDPAGVATYFRYNAVGQLTRQTDHLGNTSHFRYYPAGHIAAGRQRQIIDPEGGVTESIYSEVGQMIEETGTGTYRKTFGYDQFGAMTALTTYGQAGPATTVWLYDEGSGVLLHKIYDYVDGGDPGVDVGDLNGKEVSYTYNAAGQLKTREWARNLTTTYGYNSMGDLVSVSNPNQNPDLILYIRDRLGRASSVWEKRDGVAEVTALSYDPASGQPLGVQYPSNHSYLPGVRLDYSGPDLYGRPVGYTVKVPVDGMLTAVGNPVSYSYHPDTGQLEEVTGAYTHTYGYLPDGRVAAVSSAPGQTVTKSFDLAGRLSGIETKTPNPLVQGTPMRVVARAGYQLDRAGRRTRLVREDGTYWQYGYNLRGEVISGSKHLPSGTVLTGQEFEYAYDGIGNRTSASFGARPNLRTISYQSNEENQYIQIDHPRYFNILALAENSSTIASSTVARNATDPDPFEATAEKTGSSIWHRLEIDANGLEGADDDEWTLTTTTIDRAEGGSDSGDHWIPPDSRIPQYDADGNLETDGKWDYVWDAENRLIEMTTTAAAESELVHYGITLRFAYDWAGRRIAKEVTYTDLDPNDEIDPPADTDLRFVYDGWNLAAEFDATGTGLELKRSYTWGLDLSESFQGAGGVGGLLEATYPGADPEANADDKTAFPAYDGNGNIIAWSAAESAHVNDDPEDPDTDTILRFLDYDPFGNVHVRHNPKKREGTVGAVFDEEIPVGFSTKYHDVECGLYYYGFRYYDLPTGRWISRDPIEERGGTNLYGFVENSSQSNYDVHGLWGEVRRTGKQFAEVCADGDDKNWIRLAIDLELNYSEASKWVANYDPVPVSGKTYAVPNVIYAIRGRAYGKRAYDPDDFAKTKRAEEKYFESKLDRIAKVWKDKGYEVTKNRFLPSPGGSWLYGIVFVGHGGKLPTLKDAYIALDLSSAGRSGTISDNELWGDTRAAEWKPPYGLGYVKISSCFASQGQWYRWLSNLGSADLSVGAIGFGCVGKKKEPLVTRSGLDNKVLSSQNVSSGASKHIDP